MSIVTVHYASMIATQNQPGPLAAFVTAGSPATFSGMAPSTVAELNQYNESSDFAGGDDSAWEPDQYVQLKAGKYYWDGESWSKIVLPNPPTDVEGTDAETGGTVDLEWAAPSNAVAISTYTIYVYEDDEQVGDPIETESSDTEFTVEDLDDGTEYRFTVTATNLAGTSQPSEPSDGVTPTTAE
jgi:hypothetical protein